MQDEKTQENDNIQGLDEDEGTEEITLTSKNGTKFTIIKKHALISKLIEKALENDKDATNIPIVGVTEDVLKLIVRFMKHHEGSEKKIIEKPLKSTRMSEVCKDPWDVVFMDEIDVKRQTLYDVILAANYMDIKSLLHLGCAKVASLIKGKPLQQVKNILEADGSGDEFKSKD